MREEQVQPRPANSGTSPVKLSPDIAAMLRAIAWFTNDTVADLTRPHLIEPITKQFLELPEFARQKWINENPALQGFCSNKDCEKPSAA